MKNTQLAQSYIQAAYTGDIPLAGSYLADDVILYMDGNNDMKGVYKGRDAFFNAFGKMLEMTKGTYRMKEQLEWLEGKDRTVLVAIEAAEKNGMVHEFYRAIEYGIENEKIKYIKIFEADPTIVDVVFKAD